MKALKITLIGIGSAVILILIAFGVYLLVNIQGVVESFEVNSPELEQKVLIASQESDFKNALVENLTEHLGEKQVYIKVVDVSALGGVKMTGISWCLYITIVHITVLLVALTAYKMGHKDKIRFVKSFVPNFLRRRKKVSFNYSVSSDYRFLHFFRNLPKSS